MESMELKTNLFPPNRDATSTMLPAYGERLFTYTHDTRAEEMHFFEHRKLHRLNILYLQNKLVFMKARFWANPGVEVSETGMDELKNVLHDYTTAIQDYDYFRSLSSMHRSKADEARQSLLQVFPEMAKLPGEPLDTRYCKPPGDKGGIASDPFRDSLKRILPNRLTYTKSERDRRIDQYRSGVPPEKISPFVDNVARFLIAITGGVSLIVPMLIMSLPTVTKTKSLVTTSIAVTIFAFVMAVGIKAENMDTLVSTATYAAVLVVFVGTNG